MISLCDVAVAVTVVSPAKEFDHFTLYFIILIVHVWTEQMKPNFDRKSSNYISNVTYPQID